MNVLSTKTRKERKFKGDRLASFGGDVWRWVEMIVRVEVGGDDSEVGGGWR